MKRLPVAALLALLFIPGNAVAQHHGGSHPRKKASGTGVPCGKGYISSSYTCHKDDDASAEATAKAPIEQSEPSSTSYDGEQQRADSETVAAEREMRERRAAWLAQHPGDTTTETENRDAEGHIIRSEAARRLFMAQTGYANGREGYVIDHVKPLACGGADDPSNMQWQTVEEAQAKDKVERLGCHP
jgi:hypothetical protein